MPQNIVVRHSIQQLLLDGVENSLHKRLRPRRFLLLHFLAFAIRAFVLFATRAVCSRGPVVVAGCQARHAARDVTEDDHTAAGETSGFFALVG